MSKRLQREKTILMVCDMQDNFAQLTYFYEGVLTVALSMIKSAQKFDIPILFTEHRKKALSQTIPLIKLLLQQNKYPVVIKEKFSMIVPQIQQFLQNHPDRKQIILIGMQAHVCVLQTYLDLKNLGYDVWVIADAVTSLSSFERSIGLKRLQKQGAEITSFQTVIFELLRYSFDDNFSELCDIMNQTTLHKTIDHM